MTTTLRSHFVKAIPSLGNEDIKNRHRMRIYGNTTINSNRVFMVVPPSHLCTMLSSLNLKSPTITTNTTFTSIVQACQQDDLAVKTERN